MVLKRPDGSIAQSPGTNLTDSIRIYQPDEATSESRPTLPASYMEQMHGDSRRDQPAGGAPYQLGVADGFSRPGLSTGSQPIADAHAINLIGQGTSEVSRPEDDRLARKPLSDTSYLDQSIQRNAAQPNVSKRLPPCPASDARELPSDNLKVDCKCVMKNWLGQIWKRAHTKCRPSTDSGCLQSIFGR